MYSYSHFFNDCGVKLKFTAGEKALKWPIGAGDLVGGLFSLSASPKFKKKKKWGGRRSPSPPRLFSQESSLFIAHNL